MTQRSENALSFCAATAIGLAVSTGHPVGLAAAAGMPIVCLLARSRKTAFESTLGYYTAGLWPMIPGLQRYIGSVGESAHSVCGMALRGDSAFDAMDGRLD